MGCEIPVKQWKNWVFALKNETLNVIPHAATNDTVGWSKQQIMPFSWMRYEFFCMIMPVVLWSLVLQHVKVYLSRELIFFPGWIFDNLIDFCPNEQVADYKVKLSMATEDQKGAL